MLRRIRVEPRRELYEAARDFFYLLERGYGRKTSLDMVSSRWLLSRYERLLLYRSLYPTSVSGARIRKRLSPSALKGRVVVVDGFNVVSTVASAMIGDTLVEGNDGFIRDLAATVRKVKAAPPYFSSLAVAASLLSRLGPSRQIWVFDSQISRSAEFLSAARLYGEAILSKNADKEVATLSRTLKGVAASSDSVIIDMVEECFDLGGEAARAVAPENIVTLRSVLENIFGCLSRI